MAKRRGEALLAARRRADGSWHGTAFVVEALLLAFLAFALAVFMQLFGAAHARGMEERQLTHAVLLASNEAERFSAAPRSGSTSTAVEVDGTAYGVTREVTSLDTEGGTLYRAVITVESDGATVYALETARYVSEGAKGGDGA